MSKELAELLFPDVKETVSQLLERFPERGRAAFRFAPSPTGYLHIGNLMTCNIVYRVARAMDGVFLLRIEDTDHKREAPGAAEYLVKALGDFDIKFDEGFDGSGDTGKYGPYIQSKRVGFYHVFAKRMVEIGRAYPCFCGEGELDEMRRLQEEGKQKTGYYGKYAKCKGLSIERVAENIAAGKPWVLRFDSTADIQNAEQRIEWDDLVKGKMSLPVECNHPIILKSNGIPPYNFAHVVDDTLMRISHVTRADEWLVSTAEHIQIFRALGLEPPRYGHLPALCVEEEGSRRKISKRKDKFAMVQFFLDEGYPRDAIIEYLLTLSNSNFEIWRIQNPRAHYSEFKATLDKIGRSSPLFDWSKLNDISKNVIAKMTCAQIDAEVASFWGRVGMQEKIDMEVIYKALAIDRETEKPRKDIVKYSDILPLYSYLFESPCMGSDISAGYAKIYNHADSRDEWFARIKAECVASGVSVKDYTRAIRLALVGRENSPDMYSIMQILGRDEVIKRLLK